MSRWVFQDQASLTAFAAGLDRWRGYPRTESTAHGTSSERTTQRVQVAPTGSPWACTFQSFFPTDQTYLQSDAGTTQNLPRIIADGNSLIAGQEASREFVRVVCDLLAPYQAYDGEGYGVGGQTTAQMSSDAGAQIDPRYSASRPRNILLVWEGTNHLFLDEGLSAADAFAAITSYCQARKTANAGWQIVVLTVLPRTVAGGSTFEARRQSLNALIRAGHASYDAVADVGADATIGAAGAFNNATYYSDLTHLSDAGQLVAAALVRDAILALP
jgi:lysophospholipase L1-like esterase